MAKAPFDVLILVDPRFMGGTATSVASDVRTFSAAGVSVGMYFVEGQDFFLPHETANPALEALFDLPGVERVSSDGPLAARLACFHHPQPFQVGVANPASLTCDRAVIVAHQAPFKGDGALDYDPFAVQSRIRTQFGVRPLWAPISGVCRAQLQSFAPLLRLTTLDWINTFDVADWAPKREKLTSPDLTVGRHGRPHAEKWGDSPAEIAASLPAGPHTHIRTMGTDPAFFEDMGLDVSRWDVLAFNAEPVTDFLDSLDVFAYFYSSRWTETFGRTVAEAMLMGARCILDPGLRVTFGPHAIYCQPSEVASVLDTIRHDLVGARQAAAEARDYCLEAYATSAIPARYEALLSDTGTTSRGASPSASPFTAARKWTGFHKRRRQDKRLTA
ncbi:MAG: glycosyltransferase family 1 protein [Pseudomonadota bacterium]